MAKNRLQIKAGTLDLELNGDADYIRDAYSAMRSVVLARFQEALEADANGASTPPRRSEPPALPDDVPPPQNKPKPTVFRPDSNTTNPLFRLDAVKQQVEAGKELVQVQLQMIVCTSLYRRVAALSRRDFQRSLFGNTIDADALATVYLNEGAADRLANQMAFGNTLWRELTKAGKAIVQGESG